MSYRSDSEDCEKINTKRSMDKKLFKFTSREDRQELHRSFFSIDKDRDGYVSQDDLLVAMTKRTNDLPEEVL